MVAAAAAAALAIILREVLEGASILCGAPLCPIGPLGMFLFTPSL